MIPPAEREVVVFTTGGTISFVPGTDGFDASLKLRATDLVDAVDSGPGVRLRPVTFRQVPSADLTVADVVELAHAIDAAVADGATGAVVSQGTDTLEETAYLLELLVRTSAPVVVTGAMRNSGLPGADGPANLDAAVRVAASPLAYDVGVLVVFGDEIHLARAARKRHSSFPAAFESAGVGPVGWLNEGRVRIPVVPRHRTPRIAVDRSATIPQVALIRAGIDTDPQSVTWPVRAGHAGAVIEVFGAGHLSSRTMAAARALAERMPVVFCSRTGSGETFTRTADYPGSEKDLLASGLIPGGALDGLKARVQLALLLAAGANPAEIAASFASTTG